ncbi:MAG: glycosyltransferase family 2 protein [Coriobacteriia bacterium]|nr:glycosyltransferase family 2 protein [Coriobacteriia bacterium]
MPVYNEAATVADVLDAVRGYYPGEIIVVDDGSTDETPRILATRNDIAVVRMDCNCGYGCALRIGFDVAREIGIERLVTMDCDGQHEPAHIPQFFSALEQGARVVSGSRYLPGSGAAGAVPTDRREINARVTAMINDATGWTLTDAFCGFKGYDVAMLGGLKLSEAGYAMPIELWARIWRAGLDIVEIPVERIYCDHNRSFGAALDDPESRWNYYVDVWNRAIEEGE